MLAQVRFVLPMASRATLLLRRAIQQRQSGRRLRCKPASPAPQPRTVVPRAASTYVSKHHVISKEEVHEYLSSIPDIELRDSGDQVVVKDCSVLPSGFCGKPSGTEKPDNQWKVYFKGEGGVW